MNKAHPKKVGKGGEAADLLQEELRRMKELAARAQADLQNARMRAEKEAHDIRRFAAEGMLIRLLPTLDNFQRAIRHCPPELKSHEWVRGMMSVEQELMRQLEAVGFKRMELLGQSIDPQKHEVLLSGPGENGKVIEVLEDGYELHGKVLRAAKVKVGSGEVPQSVQGS
ncbi:nucleotide exchange factor GrpE [Candidatus Peribacteria bacterium RIFCSPHIGHO2_01_FULL_51_9]|nr:MAG: nucleotide exchange factor GrpE [Candidatus Peribacteria bacterium RIFCSPHIGHO2_01_FULL_51_9]